MLLVVDIGNTNITFGIFENGNLLCSFREVSDAKKSSEWYINRIFGKLKNFDITECIITSVVKNLDKTIKKAIDKICCIDSIIYKYNAKNSIKLNVEEPNRVGYDRIANAIAAKQYNLPAIIVDVGTATTFDIVEKDGSFSGGIIMPGIKTQFASLNQYTSLLPLVTPKEIDRVIGKTTEECILSGVIRGHASSIDGLIEKCQKEIGKKACIIGTGGFIRLISKYMTKHFDIIDENLTLCGLRLLYEQISSDT